MNSQQKNKRRGSHSLEDELTKPHLKKKKTAKAQQSKNIDLKIKDLAQVDMRMSTMQKQQRGKTDSLPENIQKKLSLPDALKGLKRNDDKFSPDGINRNMKSHLMPDKQISKKISKTAAEKRKGLKKMESRGFESNQLF